MKINKTLVTANTISLLHFPSPNYKFPQEIRNISFIYLFLRDSQRGILFSKPLFWRVMFLKKKKQYCIKTKLYFIILQEPILSSSKRVGLWVKISAHWPLLYIYYLSKNLIAKGRALTIKIDANGCSLEITVFNIISTKSSIKTFTTVPLSSLSRVLLSHHKFFL